MQSNVMKKKTFFQFFSFPLFANIFILFIFNIKLKYINCQVDCLLSYNSSCPECSLCGDEKNAQCECEWNEENQLCQSKTTSDTGLKEWYVEISTSCDITKEYNSYCSSKTSFALDDFVENQIKITIDKDENDYYGQFFKVCRYEYTDESMENTYQINVDYSPENKILFKPIIAFSYSYKEGNQSKGKTLTISDNYEENFSQITKFVFIVLFKDNYTFNPVSITITLTSNLKTKLLVTFAIGFVIILIIFAVICCTSNYLNRRTREHLRLLRAQRDLQIYQPMDMGSEVNQDELKENNTEKLTKIFEVLMPEHLYKKEYNQYGGGCSICLENFKKNSKVSITTCNHVFHYKCINEWLFKNILCPKCPNCNHEILEDYDKINNNNFNNNNSNGEQLFGKKIDKIDNDIKTIQVKKKNDGHRRTMDFSSQNPNIDISVVGMRNSVVSTSKRNMIGKKKKKRNNE